MEAEQGQRAASGLQMQLARLDAELKALEERRRAVQADYNNQARRAVSVASPYPSQALAERVFPDHLAVGQPMPLMESLLRSRKVHSFACSHAIALPTDSSNMERRVVEPPSEQTAFEAMNLLMNSACSITALSV